MPLFKLAVFAVLAVSQDEYRERRARLRAALPESAVVLFAAPDTSGDPRSQLLQEPSFYYFTGWTEPNAVLVILPEAEQPNEILFLPPRNERKEKFEGRRSAFGDSDANGRTGFRAVMSLDLWEAELKRRAGSAQKIYSPAGARDRVKQAVPEAEIHDAAPAVTRLRMVKSPREIALLQRSIDTSIAAHLAGWKRARPGVFEYQIAATMTSAILERGCERHAYRPVLGSGPNSVILHYGVNHRRIDRGEVLLMDVGAECSSYAADITRTIPVGGRFTARQRELYETVLGAQKAAIAAVKPGATLGPRGTVTEAARVYLDQHGKGPRGEPLSRFFSHGIGHHVGLEVHDASIPGDPLAAGMVITIEPGVYIQEENIGIRIEDMVLVTANGARVLSKALPREAAEIEKRLSKQ